MRQPCQTRVISNVYESPDVFLSAYFTILTTYLRTNLLKAKNFMSVVKNIIHKTNYEEATIKNLLTDVKKKTKNNHYYLKSLSVSSLTTLSWAKLTELTVTLRSGVNWVWLLR